MDDEQTAHDPPASAANQRAPRTHDFLLVNGIARLVALVIVGAVYLVQR